jgi:hypothetical protein
MHPASNRLRNITATGRAIKDALIGKTVFGVEVWVFMVVIVCG